MTEIGKADKELVEKVFDEYVVHMELPKSKNGGAAILILKDKFIDVQYKTEKFNMNCKCSGCLVETVFLTLKSDNSTIHAGCIYRHPNGNINHFNESLSEFINQYKFKNNEMSVIGGDINIDLLKTNHNPTKNYFDIMTSNNYIPNIVVPTRFTSDYVTLIDHIFVRLPKSKINNKITAGNLICDISDHLPNFSIINLNIIKNRDRPYIRLFNKANILNFQANVENDLSELLME